MTTTAGQGKGEERKGQRRDGVERGLPSNGGVGGGGGGGLVTCATGAGGASPPDSAGRPVQRRRAGGGDAAAADVVVTPATPGVVVEARPAEEKKEDTPTAASNGAHDDDDDEDDAMAEIMANIGDDSEETAEETTIVAMDGEPRRSATVTTPSPAPPADGDGSECGGGAPTNEDTGGSVVGSESDRGKRKRSDSSSDLIVDRAAVAKAKAEAEERADRSSPSSREGAGGDEEMADDRGDDAETDGVGTTAGEAGQVGPAEEDASSPSAAKVAADVAGMSSVARKLLMEGRGRDEYVRSITCGKFVLRPPIAVDEIGPVEDEMRRAIAATLATLPRIEREVRAALVGARGGGDGGDDDGGEEGGEKDGEGVVGEVEGGYDSSDEMERRASARQGGGGDGGSSADGDECAEVAAVDDEGDDHSNDDDMDEDAVVRGGARAYQMAFLEQLKVKNTIVNLGTGMGKTYIALMGIQYFLERRNEQEAEEEEEEEADDDESGVERDEEDDDDADDSPLDVPEKKKRRRQAVFLVPSVALAVQHSITLKSNLPAYRVSTACNTASHSNLHRERLADADIVVATHGAMLDMLQHYGDVFSLDRVCLLILDECHYATGAHSYSRIMEIFYHRLEPERRPRVLGLTASPLINVKQRLTRDQLELMMSELEWKLDSHLTCFSSHAHLKQPSRNVRERVIRFSNEPIWEAFPDHEDIGLHYSRIKEVNQLVELYHELGPKVTGEYSATLSREIARNRYERETIEEYKLIVDHLKFLSEFCLAQCDGPDGGRTHKMIVLEKELVRLLEEDAEEYELWGECSSDNVGVVFVERRITALALYCYFKGLRKEYDAGRVRDGVAACVRCDMIVRQSTKVFRYLHHSHRFADRESAEIEGEWLHQMKKIRVVLDGLRKKEINVLIATSVVEEGVDVPACSFVIVLDDIRTTKGYVQMKGRARQESAQFSVFQNVHPDAPKPPITLEEAQEVEKRIEMFIAERQRSPEVTTFSFPLLTPKGTSIPCEDVALEEGEYRAPNGRVDLLSAKSLLNRYSLSIPMDATTRSSRQTMLLNMPIYDDVTLTLPAHLPRDIRSVCLPELYHDVSRRDCQNMLALMACVRLHRLKLLNDRLLPLDRRDMNERLLSVALRKFPAVKPLSALEHFPTSSDAKKVYLYRLVQRGDVFAQHDEVLSHGSPGRTLGLISLKQMNNIPNFSFDHVELGLVTASLEDETVIDMMPNEWAACANFFTVVMSGRWRRRTGRLRFFYDADSSLRGVLSPYLLAALTAEGTIDWERMRGVVEDYSRTDDERCAAAEAACSGSETMEPRLYAPVYDPNVTYIAFGSAGLTCAANFPYDDMYENYADYFGRRRGFQVEEDNDLIAVQRQWTLPRKMKLDKGTFLPADVEIKEKKFKEFSSNCNDGLKPGERAPCRGLGAALLAKESCMEVPVADAQLFHHCILMPQILFYMNRCLTGHAFIEHCKERFSRVGTYLERVPLEDLLEALTARSCSMSVSYDRLEYLGDAVLKLIHTDALLHARELHKWISYLHEGDLSTLRSAMGCNERLKNASLNAGLQNFILTTPLGRGQWLPVGLDSYVVGIGEHTDAKPRDFVYAPTGKEVKRPKPSNKTCADVVEALLGLVYLHFGYKASVEVAEDLGITIPDQVEPTYDYSDISMSTERRNRLHETAKSFIDKSDFRSTSILLEAVTHPSCIHEEVPSYQRLEWIGDAILCIAAREWVYTEFPEMPVSQLVVVETTLVCNETLAYLSLKRGLNGVINHRDPNLPPKIEDFEGDLASKHRGLWGTDPPKVLADIVEALLGAAHTDGGFKDGQKAANAAMRPMLEAVANELKDISDDADAMQAKMRSMMQPKQVMYEMAFMLLQVRPWKEHAFAMRYPKFPVWRGTRWEKSDYNSNGYIGQIVCAGIHLMAIAEASPNVAQNRACALAVAVLCRNPEIITSLQQIAARLVVTEDDNSPDGVHDAKLIEKVIDEVTNVDGVKPFLSPEK